MTHIRRYSISKKNEKKVLEALDKWNKRGPIISEKICEAIIKLHEEEEQGNKLTTYTMETKPLDLFPKITEPWTPQMLQQFNVADLQQVVAELYKRREELGSYLNMLAKLR